MPKANIADKAHIVEVKLLAAKAQFGVLDASPVYIELVDVGVAGVDDIRIVGLAGLAQVFASVIEVIVELMHIGDLRGKA